MEKRSHQCESRDRLSNLEVIWIVTHEFCSANSYSGCACTRDVTRIQCHGRLTQIGLDRAKWCVITCVQQERVDDEAADGPGGST